MIGERPDFAGNQFVVNDRVRVRPPSPSHGGEVGTVTKVSTEWPDEYEVQMDRREDPSTHRPSICIHVYDGDELEHVQEPSEGEGRSGA